jgi:F-type H+-transporting ATPase subunit b
MSEILQQLGLNSTLFLQASLFIVTVLFLRYFVFKPYVEANAERVKRTTGSEAETEGLHQELNVLESKYEMKAKDLHAEVSSIYLKKKTEAASEAEKIIQKARAQALASNEQLKKEIQSEAEKARLQVPIEVKNIAAIMVQKLLGKGA